MMEAAENGYTHMTHFYSCMKGVERINGMRIAGAIEAAYINDDITVEIIADGMHLPYELLQMVYKIKGADRSGLTLEELERQRILQALEQYDNNLSQVASALGLSRPALYRRLEKHNIVI